MQKRAKNPSRPVLLRCRSTSADFVFLSDVFFCVRGWNSLLSLHGRFVRQVSLQPISFDVYTFIYIYIYLYFYKLYFILCRWVMRLVKVIACTVGLLYIMSVRRMFFFCFSLFYSLATLFFFFVSGVKCVCVCRSACKFFVTFPLALETCNYNRERRVLRSE